MANDGTISSRLQLDGEQQYKKALNDAYRSLRVLRSELKAETAEMGRNATEQDKARAKMQSLQKQIQEQQKIVKTLEKALQDSKKEYADNQEVQDKWAEKLNKARAALAEMENSLGACEDGLKGFSDGMKDVSDSSGQAVQTVVSFNDAMKSIGNIASTLGGAVSGIFTNTLDTMQDMVNGMLSLMSMAWSAAGEWDQIQTVWGGDLESIEKVYTAMALQGIDASQVTSGIQKFITNVHNGNEDTLAALEQLHMSEDQFSSHWDFFVAVMDKASMFKGQEQYNLMTALFGDKKGAGMTDMLKNWRDAMNRYQKDVEETGMELSTPEIDKLNEVAHKITEIQELWNVVKTNLGAKLSSILNMDQLSEDVLEILRDVGAIFNSEGEDRKELVIKLSDDITKLITDVEAAMGNLSEFLKELGGDLEKSDNPLVRFIGQLISGLGGILDWLSVHGTEITGFLEKALPWILQNKILEATTGEGIGGWAKTLMDLGMDVATLTMLGKSLGKGAATEITAAGTSLGSGILSTLASGLPEILIVALAAVPILDLILHPDKYNKTQPEVQKVADGTNTLEVLNTPDGGKNALHYLVTGKQEGYDIPTLDVGIPVKKTPNGTVSGFEITEAQAEAAEAFWDMIRRSENPTVTADFEREALLEAFQGSEDIAANLETLMTWLISQGEGEEQDNLPEGWYQIIGDINGSLKNLIQEKYSGSNDEDLPGRIGTAVGNAVKSQPITVNVYVDGEKVTEGVNTRLGSLLSAGLFG